jgi:hypothetical protein
MGDVSDDNLEDVPSVSEYRRVLPGCVRDSRTQKETQGHSIVREMLNAHYHANLRTLTSGELAELVGLTNFGDVNLRYGKCAALLCERLNRHPKFFIATLATFTGGRWDDPFVRWTMLPQVATALEEMGWVTRA